MEKLEEKTKTKDPFLKIELQELGERVILGLLGAVGGATLWGGGAYFMTSGNVENPLKVAYIVGGIGAVMCGLYCFGGCSWDGEDDQIRERYDQIAKKCSEDMNQTKIS